MTYIGSNDIRKILYLDFIALTRLPKLNCSESFIFSRNCLCLMERKFKSKIYPELQYLTIYLLTMAYAKKAKFMVANNIISVVKRRKNAFQGKPQ